MAKPPPIGVRSAENQVFNIPVGDPDFRNLAAYSGRFKTLLALSSTRDQLVRAMVQDTSLFTITQVSCGMTVTQACQCTTCGGPLMFCPHTLCAIHSICSKSPAALDLDAMMSAIKLLSDDQLKLLAVSASAASVRFAQCLALEAAAALEAGAAPYDLRLAFPPPMGMANQRLERWWEAESGLDFVECPSDLMLERAPPTWLEEQLQSRGQERSTESTDVGACVWTSSNTAPGVRLAMTKVSMTKRKSLIHGLQKAKTVSHTVIVAFERGPSGSEEEGKKGTQEGGKGGGELGGEPGTHSKFRPTSTWCSSCPDQPWWCPHVATALLKVFVSPACREAIKQRLATSLRGPGSSGGAIGASASTPASAGGSSGGGAASGLASTPASIFFRGGAPSGWAPPPANAGGSSGGGAASGSAPTPVNAGGRSGGGAASGLASIPANVAKRPAKAGAKAAGARAAEPPPPVQQVEEPAALPPTHLSRGKIEACMDDLLVQVGDTARLAVLSAALRSQDYGSVLFPHLPGFYQAALNFPTDAAGAGAVAAAAAVVKREGAQPQPLKFLKDFLAEKAEGFGKPQKPSMEEVVVVGDGEAATINAAMYLEEATNSLATQASVSRMARWLCGRANEMWELGRHAEALSLLRGSLAKLAQIQIDLKREGDQAGSDAVREEMRRETLQVLGNCTPKLLQRLGTWCMEKAVVYPADMPIDKREAFASKPEDHREELLRQEKEKGKEDTVTGEPSLERAVLSPLVAKTMLDMHTKIRKKVEEEKQRKSAADQASGQDAPPNISYALDEYGDGKEVTVRLVSEPQMVDELYHMAFGVAWRGLVNATRYPAQAEHEIMELVTILVTMTKPLGSAPPDKGEKSQHGPGHGPNHGKKKRQGARLVPGGGSSNGQGGEGKEDNGDGDEMTGGDDGGGCGGGAGPGGTHERHDPPTLLELTMRALPGCMKLYYNEFPVDDMAAFESTIHVPNAHAKQDMYRIQLIRLMSEVLIPLHRDATVRPDAPPLRGFYAKQDGVNQRSVPGLRRLRDIVRTADAEDVLFHVLLFCEAVYSLNQHAILTKLLKLMSDPYYRTDFDFVLGWAAKVLRNDLQDQTHRNQALTQIQLMLEETKQNTKMKNVVMKPSPIHILVLDTLVEWPHIYGTYGVLPMDAFKTRPREYFARTRPEGLQWLVDKASPACLAVGKVVVDRAKRASYQHLALAVNDVVIFYVTVGNREGFETLIKNIIEVHEAKKAIKSSMEAILNFWRENWPEDRKHWIERVLPAKKGLSDSALDDDLLKASMRMIKEMHKRPPTKQQAENALKQPKPLSGPLPPRLMPHNQPHLRAATLPVRAATAVALPMPPAVPLVAPPPRQQLLLPTYPPTQALQQLPTASPAQGLPGSGSNGTSIASATAAGTGAGGSGGGGNRQAQQQLRPQNDPRVRAGAKRSVQAGEAGGAEKRPRVCTAPTPAQGFGDPPEEGQAPADDPEARPCKGKGKGKARRV